MALTKAHEDLLLNRGVGTLTDAANIDWDTDLYPVAKVTLAGNRTFNLPTNAVTGDTYLLEVWQDSTGTRLITWATEFKWKSGIAPTLTTTATTGMDVISFYFDGTFFRGYVGHVGG